MRITTGSGGNGREMELMKQNHQSRIEPLRIKCGIFASLRMGCVLTLVLTVSVNGFAQSPDLRDLTQASLEDLMNIQVTSVSKKEQSLSKTGAAIYVITQDDIRRSGMTNIPDLLRMVPGVDVAQIDANAWAISIRGFSYRYATKVLVLVDGRTVYTHQ